MNEKSREGSPSFPLAAFSIRSFSWASLIGFLAFAWPA
jgi:hypothetical protein